MQSAERSLAVANRLYSASPAPCFDDFRLKALYKLSYAHSELKDARADATLAQTFRAREQGAKGDAKDILQHPGFHRADQALPIARAITELAPRELNGWELLAAAQLQLKNYAEAVTALEKGISTIPAPKVGDQASGLYRKLQERLERYREKLAAAARQ